MDSSKSALINPFDFSNPVTDGSVLAGREKEMQEATYYLDQGREGSSYSLALIGERASGKTSLLNALREYANETHLVAAQVRLDEGLAKNELNFFREVFHSLMDACADREIFGGLEGAEYDVFRRQVLTLDLDTPRNEEPLAFGRVYATAESQGRPIQLSRRMLQSDLGVIADRAGEKGFPGIVLLIDEGDLLSENHTLLQMIRNLLMDSKHLALIVAGTDQMFPAISDVFSPIPRQFVRINVGPFDSWEGTRKAVLRRLVLAKQDWAMPNIEECREIHSLTHGSPYEVMLVSHCAYRELTRARRRVPMTITPEVIGAVADQLEQQNPSVQETLAKLRNLDRTEGETIRELVDLDGLSVDRFALATLDFTEEYDERKFLAAREKAMKSIERLRDTGFVDVRDGRVSIDADPFQRALIKYEVLRHRDAGTGPTPLLSDPRRQIADRVAGALKSALEAGLDGVSLDGLIMEVHRDASSVSLKLALDADSFPADEYQVEAIYRIDAGTNWTGVFVFKNKDSPKFREQVADVLAAEATRLREFDVEISEIEIGLVDPSKLEAFRNNLVDERDPLEELVEEARDAFMEGRPKYQERVASACSAILERDNADDDEWWREINDCAFIALGSGDGDSYELLSDRAEALAETPLITTVTRALWEATKGQFGGALERLDISEDEFAGTPEQLRDQIFMYSPAVLAGEVTVVTQNDVLGDLNLVDVVHSYRVAILAKEEGGSVADALASVSNAPAWVVGAAADAAIAEGRLEAAEEFRRQMRLGGEKSGGESE
ncbi:MAG TPA: ATP-binding protein [Solirubrobacterales bacterium]|nr:ATP-binding protein [Solirubrobacterales bacterium]